MSRIQCGGFNFDDQSFETKIVNGEKVLGNKHGGVVTYTLDKTDTTNVYKIDASFEEFKGNIENGNFLVFILHPMSAGSGTVYYLTSYFIAGSTITFIIVSHSSSGDTYRKFKYQDGYMMEIES